MYLSWTQVDGSILRNYVFGFDIKRGRVKGEVGVKRDRVRIASGRDKKLERKNM